MAKTSAKHRGRVPSPETVPRAVLRARLAAFLVERFPFAAAQVLAALEREVDRPPERAGEDPVGAIEALRPRVARKLRRLAAPDLPRDVGEPTPGVTARERWDAAVELRIFFNRYA